MGALAFVRPHDWDFPLFLHVLGAMVLVGALVLALGYLVGAWRGGSAESLRLGFRVLLYGAFPAYIVMRVGAQWVEVKENLDDLAEDPTWLGIGYITADLGGLLLIIALILGGIGLRRARKGGGGAGLLKATGVIATLLVAVYIVAVWAMGGKPT